MFNKKLCSFGLAIFTLFPLSTSKSSICKAVKSIYGVLGFMDPNYFFDSDDPIIKGLIDRCDMLLCRFEKLKISLKPDKKTATREDIESYHFLHCALVRKNSLIRMNEAWKVSKLDEERYSLSKIILGMKILFIRKCIKFLLKFENTNHLQDQVYSFKFFSFGGHVLNLYDIRHKSFVLESIVGGKNVLYGVLPYNERNDAISLAIALCKHINYYFNFFLTEAFDLCYDTLTKHEE